VQGRPRRVLKRIAYRVARDRSLVRLASLPAVDTRAGLDVFLRVVPRASHVVEEQRHHDASHRAEHEVASEDLRTQQRLSLELADLESNDIVHNNSQQ
jgi:hypothetical protein